MKYRVSQQQHYKLYIQYHVLAHSYSLLSVAPGAYNAIKRLDRSIRRYCGLEL